MLRIHTVMLEVIRLMRPVLAQIARYDRELESQARRAETSAVLNIAEGSGARGRNRPAKYSLARSEAEETYTCLQVAEAQGYIDRIDPEIESRLKQVIGTLVNLTR